MFQTRKIPTDKFGRVYHGPKTYDEALFKIDERIAFDLDPTGSDYSPETIAAEVIAEVERAGYTGVATRLRKHFGLQQ